jgi:hypothetical protein
MVHMAESAKSPYKLTLGCYTSKEARSRALGAVRYPVKSASTAPAICVESDGARISLSLRMILSEKSATFQDHALENRSPRLPEWKPT